MASRRFLMACLACVLVFSVTESSPIGPAAEDVDTDPSTGTSGHHSAPDLLHMLGAVKGGNGMQELTDVYKEYSLLTHMVKFVFSFSPVLTRLSKSAAEHNAAIRVLLKAGQGEVPDVKDIYDLATNSRKKDMVSDFLDSEGKNSQFQKIKSFQSHYQSTLQSAAGLTEFVKIATGRDVELSQKLVTDVNSGDVKLSKQNLANVNLVNALHYCLKNFQEIYSSALLVARGQHDDIFRNVLQIITKLDISSLENIKSINSAVINDKYKVTVGEGFVTDPKVVSITQDIDQARKLLKGRTLDDDKALTLLDHLEKQFSSLFDQVFQDASQQAVNTMKQI